MPRSFHLGILREERVVERVMAAWVLVAWALVESEWGLVAWVLVAWVLVASVLVAGASSKPHNPSRHRRGTACHGDCMAAHRTH